MSTSVQDIYNWAISIVSGRGSVSGLVNDGRELEVCELWYPVIRDKILRAAPWPSCRMARRLALLKEASNEQWVNGDVHPGWKYAYSEPENMLRPRYLYDFQSFIVAHLEQNTPAIMTNAEDPILIYTGNPGDPSNYEPDLQLAIAHGLAAYICAPLNGLTERINYALQTANNALMEARVTAANQDMEKFETIPEWLEARGTIGLSQDTRFIYPHGSLLQPPSGWVNPPKK